MADIKHFDSWFQDAGPAAIVLRVTLVPVEGHDGVFFPATFAASKDGPFKGGYNIDELADGTKVCLVDSVGSQANRLEPCFSREGYSELVPQVVVVAGSRRVNLLEAGHRAGDAIVRCSEMKVELQAAFRALQRGDATPLARIAPTSLVFGAWDSRDTQAKVPRLLASTIRAYRVQELHRSAQYVPATEYVDEGLLPEPGDKAAEDAYSERGFKHVPAPWSHGGVIASGEIRRDAVVHLAALRLLASDADTETLKLRRYVLGLALTALTLPAAGYLRQGCNLVPDVDTPASTSLVHADGRREPLSLDHAGALEFAREAAKSFGVGAAREVVFDTELAKADVTGDEAKKKSKRQKKS